MGAVAGEVAEAELVVAEGYRVHLVVEEYRGRLVVEEEYRGRLEGAACHGHPEVLCLVRPLDHGHRSAVRLHSIVPAAAPRARQVRQRAPVWVPEAGLDLRFSQEPDPALVLDQD